MQKNHLKQPQINLKDYQMEKLYINKTSANNKRSIKFMAFVVLFLGGLINSYSQVRVPFAPRTASATPATTIYTIKGDFTMMGNTNLTLQNYSATANNNAAMVYVDIDGDPNTWNSSSATLSFSEENNAIPDCSNIIYAGLYWTGRAGTDEIFTVTNGTDTKEFDKRKVQLKKGITGVYQDVVATTTTDLNKNIYFPSGLDDNIYSAYAEITDYVVANGLGEYFVADIATLEGDGGNSGYYGGWGMVVVYENSKMNWRDVTVFDGHAFVRREGAAGTSTNYTFDIDGFKTSENGYINIKLGVMAGEGDVGVSGDTFGILNRTNSLYESLSHSANTPTNFFNSSINTEGNIRNPDLVNNTGVDIAMFKIDNGSNLEGDLDYNRYITNEQTSTSFQYGTSQDTYVIFNVTFSVDSYVPETEIIVENTSTNTSLVPGQSAGFKIDIKNTGTEATKNTTLTIPIPLSVDPANLTFTESVNPIYSPLVNSSPPTILPATAGNNGTIVWNMGTLPLPNNPDDVIAEINFNYNVTTDCATLNDSDFYPYVTLLGMISGTGETSGEDFDFNLIQGYETNGICEGEPIIAPLEIPINFNNYVNEPPTASNPTSINVECMDDVPAFDITVVTDEADNQGTPIVAFVSDVSDGNTCPETITRTYSVTDDCNNSINVTQIITISPIAITYTAPSDNISDACDYVAQSNLDTAFNNWVDAQTAAFSIANGCSPVLTNDSATASIPVLCDGGATTITWTITDLCQTITETADFTVTAPVAITYTAPASDASNASEFYDPDATIAQANLDADIAAWLATQNATVNGSVTDGCNPVITNDYINQSISFCASDSITVTWTITDLCETINFSATYTFTQPDGISFTEPSSRNTNACDFDNDDITVAQSDLDADIATWVNNQTNIIINTLTGGSPTVTNDFTNQSLDLCTGGSITINWTIDDICETINKSALYTVTAPTAITYTNPADDTSDACDYTTQSEVDTAFNNWVAAQTAAFSIANGCSPILTNNSAAAAIPVLCDGGATTITWTITDLCQTITETADFNLTAPIDITYTNPADDTSDACDFGTSDLTAAQSNLDFAIATWVTNETTRVNDSFSGGCSSTVTNDFVAQSIDFCIGGSIEITWSISDLCSTTNVSAMYTFTQPDAPTFNQSTLPSDITVECDVIPDAEALTVSNSCGNLDVIFNETITNGSCPNVYSILRTWTATNICGVSITNTQTVTVEDNTAPELTLPANITAECSDDLTPIAFGTATATDNCDANPIVTFNDVIVDGTCSGNFTITRTWTATDACGNTVSANQIISTADTTAPDFDQTTLPADLVVECDGIPAQEILTATDNCGIATVTVNDVRTDGNCPNNYIITRSYTATDECGVTNTHVQIITVQDSTPPVFVETLPNTNIVVECDAIPVAETLTATDSCDSATVSVSDSRTDGNCPNSYTIVRTWVATDVCGLTTTHTQNIIIQDTTPPTFVESLPRDTTVECDAIPDVTSLTATDNCGDALVTVSDVRTNGNCPSNYSIARTWVATDDCGLTTTHTQVINVQDTTAPVPTSTFETTLDVSCTDIPDAPEVEFTDNCSSNVIVVFDETNSFDENVITDYQIIRTWTVRDACNNEEVYTQTLNVSLDEVLNEVVAEDRCFDEGVLNLDNFLANDVFGGTWEIIEGSTIATINGSIFDPTNLDSAYSEEFNPNTDGIQYVLRYTGFQSGCINITDVIMVVDAKCRVLPCGEKDISISTAITPNGDGFNESFDIQGIDLCGFVAEIKIFNRWGALVFESNDYTLGSLKSGSGVFGDWNGSSPRSSIGNNGQLPNGTYYYIINLRNSGLNPLTGPVYLGTK